MAAHDGLWRNMGREIIDRLGFNFLAQLESLRDQGLTNINIDDSEEASQAALRTWEDNNYPYRRLYGQEWSRMVSRGHSDFKFNNVQVHSTEWVWFRYGKYFTRFRKSLQTSSWVCRLWKLGTLNGLPEDLRSFLSSSDGFCLSWTARLCGSGSTEVMIGRVRINHLSEITRILFDGDEARSIASLPFEVAHASFKTTGISHDKSSTTPDGGNESSSIILHDQRERKGITASTSTFTGGSTRAVGVAAFSLDSSCAVGMVALVYGSSRSPALSRPPLGGALSTQDCFRAPEVWLQDLSCRWHFLASNFTKYFRMMVAHLGVLGWQQAFSPTGVSPATEKCMRLYCRDRLLFDELQWKKEQASTMTPEREHTETSSASSFKPLRDQESSSAAATSTGN